MLRKLGRRRGAATGIAGLLVVLIAVTIASAQPSARIPTGVFIQAATGIPNTLDQGVFESRASTENLYKWSATLVQGKTTEPGARTLPGPFAMEPDLAQSYRRNADGSYTFVLRRARSPYGNTLSAADVKFTFEREIAVSGIDRFFLEIARVDQKNPITIINNRTVRLNVVGKSPLVLAAIGLWYGFSILDSTEVKKHATSADPWAKTWLATHTASYGPYNVTSFQPAQSIVMNANPNYYGGRFHFRQVIVRAIPDPASRLQLMLSGNASFTQGLEWRQYRAATANRNVDTQTTVDTNLDILYLNEKYAPLANKLVRKAINMAIDRAAIVKAVYQGFGKPALYTSSTSLPAPFQGPAIKADVSGARALLTRAGYPNGFELTLTGNSSAVGGTHAEGVLTLIQSQLARIGIRASLQIIPSSSEFNDKRFGRTLQTYLAATRPIIPEITYWLNLSYATGGVANDESHSYPRFDKLMAEVATTAPGKRFNRLLTSAIKIVDDEMPNANLVETVQGLIFAKGIRGYRPWAINVILPHRLSMAP